MRHSLIGHTDVRVSRISFGTASLHHLFSAQRRRHLLEAAAEAGISHFDTSPYYGYGLAETDLGIFMQGRRDRITVTTKVGLYPYGGAVGNALGVWARKLGGKFYPRLSRPVIDWSIQRAASSFDDSLGRLKSDYVDFLFLHEPDIGLVNTDEFLKWVESEQAKGKLRFWGLAGLPALLAPWLGIAHPLANVLQARDSIDRHEADFITARGRDLQFTYGYLSSQGGAGQPVPACDLIGKALLRNARGSVLVSTRKAERIKEIARLAG